MPHSSAGSRGSGLLDVGIGIGVDEGMGRGIGAAKRSSAGLASAGRLVDVRPSGYDTRRLGVL